MVELSTSFTPAIEKGATIKILGGALSLPSLCMYSGKPEIASVKDLTGKAIGIGAPGSVLQQMTVLLLKKAGVDPASVQFRNVGSNADIFRAVVAKTVDAGLSDVDVYDQQAKYGVHVLPDGLLWKQIPEYTNQGTYASDAAIAAKRDQIVHVLAAWASAYRYISGARLEGRLHQSPRDRRGQKRGGTRDESVDLDSEEPALR